MKKRFQFAILCIMFVLLLSSCAKKDENPPLLSFEAEVIEAGDHLLVAPEKDSNEFRSSDRISVGLLKTVLLDKQGNEITIEELKVGDDLEITYNGVIMESYPAQITASEIKVLGQ